MGEPARALAAAVYGSRDVGYRLEMDQLSLFTKKKAARAPAALEMAIHAMIADTLRLSIAKGWLWFHVPNGGWRSAAEAGKFKRMGVMPGVSDFILIAPRHGSVHALELKRRGQKPSEAQASFMQAVLAAGGHAAWVDSYEAALVQLKLWGAVREGIAISV